MPSRSGKRDIRNFMSMFFCRSSVDPASAGDVYSGAWAFPESSHCCGKSLQYPTMQMAATLGPLCGVADDAWAREMARRQTILMTYDAHETGVVEDRIDGGVEVTGHMVQSGPSVATPDGLEMLAWQPELFGPARENHIMRTSSVVRDVPLRQGPDCLLHVRRPGALRGRAAVGVHAHLGLGRRQALAARQDAAENGYTVKPLSSGDCSGDVRHDGCRDIVVEGVDPQETLSHDRLQYEGPWTTEDCAGASAGKLHVASQAGARARSTFNGNQVRLIGRADPSGGKADVYLDGVKQLCGIDFWCPQARDQQVLCYKNGLTQGKHRLEIVATGTKNPVSSRHASLPGRRPVLGRAG